MPRWRRILSVAALFVLALALRCAPLEHGFSRNYVPDTHAVRAALGMAKDHDLAPEVGKYSSYPYLMPYLLLPIYGAQYALGKARGEWHDAGEFGAVITEQPERAALPARALVAFFGALTALAVFFAARAAGLRGGALAAMFLTASGLLHLQMSVQERPWVIVVFFGSLCLWACVDYARTGRARSLVLSGACAGLAFAAHQAGLFFALLTACTWVFAAKSKADWSGSLLLKRVLLALQAAIVCLLVGILCGHAYYLVHGSVPESGVVGTARAAEHLTIGGQALRVGWSWHSFAHLSKTLAGYDPVLLGLGLLGVSLAWRTKHLRGPLVFTLIYAVFFLFNPSDHVRYLLPLTVLLALPAGLVCELVLERKLGRVALAILFVLPLAQAGRLVWLLRQEDTRAEAERRLEELALPASGPNYVAIDHYGPQVELSKRALEELAGLRELRMREARRLEQLKADHIPGGKLGIHALFVEELFETDDTAHVYGVKPERRGMAATPAEMLSTLGVTHFVMVNRTPADPKTPPLASLAELWIPMWIIDPSRAARGLSPEANLPTEMDFPLTGLWRVDRPGPWIALYALPR
ncbi:MAG TPA: hypothetical protein VK843_07695 [Planctomycetota bacterium]|nr:hypothetical protein [Planctomycetota bacterium]